jgi:hypothetical protein
MVLNLSGQALCAEAYWRSAVVDERMNGRKSCSPEVMVPTPNLLQQRNFNTEVSESLGHAHQRLTMSKPGSGGERTVIEGPAAEMLALMLTSSEKGLGRRIWELSDLAHELPELSAEQVEDGAAELEHCGLVDPLRAVAAAVRLAINPLCNF